ncbi:MAG: CvpA family protein [Clostridiales bacterium]|nr:CvpA family protein [Clostridiales bacterium]
MNLIDLAVVLIFVLFVLNGLYRGFLPSLFNMCGLFVSWACAFLFYPLLSANLMENPLFSSMRFYIEGAERIGTGEAFELSKLDITGIGSDRLPYIIENASLPPPFDKAVLHNIENRVYSDKGLFTLGEYFDETIYHVMMNIFAFVIIFLVILVITTLISNAFSYAAKVPEIRHFDTVTGGLIGLIRAFFFMFVLFSMIPIVLILLPVTFVTDMINDSVACSIFYSGSIILNLIAV